ncbi:hypothetical protein [Candidatus Poriferisocius sp.]
MDITLKMAMPGAIRRFSYLAIPDYQRTKTGAVLGGLEHYNR